MIRSATASDVPIIHQFINNLEETTLNSTHFADVFRRNLFNPAVHYLVAEVDGVVVGFVSCHVQHLLHHAGPVGEIHELYVRPDQRGQQIGRQLLDHLAALAQTEGFVNLEVTTNQKRIDTIRFYERESFRCTHYKLVKPIRQN